MPLVIKNCILCGGWIQRSRRKINCLCARCIRKENEKRKYSLANLRKQQDKPEEDERP